jgi:ribosomal protein S18 acetylase RimI-like enzyme
MSIQTPNFTIRSFQPRDLSACQKLYLEGLLGGKIAENDTGLDLIDIEAIYMNTEGSHFWVALNPQDIVVGTIAVQHHEPGVGQIRRLRVAGDYRRRGIGTALVETAIKFCQENSYLKIALESFMEREAAMELFKKFGFLHGSTRKFAGKDLLYFYLDFYSGSPHAQKGDAHFPGLAAH